MAALGRKCANMAGDQTITSADLVGVTDVRFGHARVG